MRSTIQSIPDIGARTSRAPAVAGVLGRLPTWVAIVALAACSSPVSMPQPTRPPSMPSPSSSPSLPSPSSRSTPSPSQPSVPSSSRDSIPSPTRSQDPSGQSEPGRPGSPEQGPSGPIPTPGDRRGERPSGDPGAERPDAGTPDGGTPEDSKPGSEGADQPQSGDDGWESSNEDPGDPGLPGIPQPPGSEAGGPRDGEAGGLPGSESDEDPQAGDGPRGIPGAQGEFEDAIGVLDGQILAERADVRVRRNETAGQHGRVALPSGGDEDERGTPTPSSGDADSTERGAMPEGEGRRRPGNRPPQAPPPVPAAPVPPDVADARDDDVVCRQLREAAIAETDTDLREGLWEDYRRLGCGK